MSGPHVTTGPSPGGPLDGRPAIELPEDAAIAACGFADRSASSDSASACETASAPAAIVDVLESSARGRSTSVLSNTMPSSLHSTASAYSCDGGSENAATL